MSKSFLFLFSKDFFKIPKEIPFEVGMPILSILCGAHICYAIGTKEEKEIIVVKKYKFDKQGFTEFMVVDINGKHYNINNSLWYWKWNSIEDWSSIKENSTINAKFYGWRVPIFGIFPNIVNSKII
jgi:hypothetical protein